MRLFIAINFNDGTKSRLLRLRDELSKKSSGGNFSLIENMHLTLVFLGECDPGQTAIVKAVMDKVKFGPFEIAIDSIGKFAREGGDIWWAGARENKALTELQRELTDKLIFEGFDLEKRKYSPHITLGRKVETDEKPWRIEPFGETTYAFELMKSERLNNRMVYTAIHRRNGEKYV